MKIEKFREMGLDELKHKLGELQDSLLKTRIQVQTKQVENTAQLGTLRRDIARVQTLVREMALRGTTAPAAPARTVEKPVVKSKTAAGDKDKPAVNRKKK